MSSLAKRVKEAAYLEGQFVTRAGKPTTYYIDKYKFTTQPHILKPLAQALAAILPPSDTYDRLAAPELGAVAIAAALSIEVGKPFVIVKKQAKEYGTQKLIEGDFRKGERMVLIEDILTTGGAVLRAYDILQAQGILVEHIVGVINREEGALEAIQDRGLQMHALLTTTDLRQA